MKEVRRKKVKEKKQRGERRHGDKSEEEEGQNDEERTPLDVEEEGLQSAYTVADIHRPTLGG